MSIQLYNCTLLVLCYSKPPHYWTEVWHLKSFHRTRTRRRACQALILDIIMLCCVLLNCNTLEISVCENANLSTSLPLFVSCPTSTVWLVWRLSLTRIVRAGLFWCLQNWPNHDVDYGIFHMCMIFSHVYTQGESVYSLIRTFVECTEFDSGEISGWV